MAFVLTSATGSSGWLARLWQRVEALPMPFRRRPLLPGEMTDHMRRDIGLADGRLSVERARRYAGGSPFPGVVSIYAPDADRY